MRLATIKAGGEVKVAAATAGGLVDLPSAYIRHFGASEAPDFLYDMKKLIAAGRPALRVVEELATAGAPRVKEAQFLPPVLNPEKILCVAVNYKAHGAETGMDPPEKPYFFPKFPNALVGHGGTVLKHRVVQRLDWEVELVVVIGRAGKYIKPEEALDYVFGYTVGIDITARDWQNPEEKTAKQFGKYWIWGKSMDTMAPVGPYVVTKDEVPDPNNLTLRLWVNGTLEQEGNTTDLIFNVQQLVSWASQGITLKPGDLIFTGTPPGVGWAKGKYLKGGDVVEAEIEGVGRLTVYVVEE